MLSKSNSRQQSPASFDPFADEQRPPPPLDPRLPIFRSLRPSVASVDDIAAVEGAQSQQPVSINWPPDRNIVHAKRRTIIGVLRGRLSPPQAPTEGFPAVGTPPWLRPVRARRESAPRRPILVWIARRRRANCRPFDGRRRAIPTGGRRTTSRRR